jgi:phytoene dehydrogenase-like protein
MIAKSVEKPAVDVVVVGGGMAGLISAALLARHGRSVVLLEQSKHLGGRASTTRRQELHFNLGPRALYVHGHAFRLLRELGVPFNGSIPSPGHSLACTGGLAYRLPRGLRQILVSRLLTWREKWQLVKLFRTLPKLDPKQWDSIPLKQWIAERYGHGNLAKLLETLFRLSTYCNDSEHVSAGAALAQFQLGAAGNVWYLDGGWQTFVDGLHGAASQHGAKFQPHAQATAIKCHDSLVTVELGDGSSLVARQAILAVGPQTACSLLGLPESHPLARWTAASRPIRAACLDLALDRLPRPQQRFALDLDDALYFSVHSAAARLGPEGVAVVHVMKYLQSEANESPESYQAELEALLDRVQPGWRSHVITQRYLPSMTVAFDFPRASDGGLSGRPRAEVADCPGVLLAGDWVGPEGQLADASAASAERAAQLALAALGTPAGITQHA